MKENKKIVDKLKKITGDLFLPLLLAVTTVATGCSEATVPKTPAPTDNQTKIQTIVPRYPTLAEMESILENNIR